MKTVYHIGDGAKQMPYDVDADNAVTRHPDEWSNEPWSVEETNAWRKADYDRRVADAKAADLPPPPSPAEIQLSPEQKTAIDEDEARRAEARKIIADDDKYMAEKRDYEAKLAGARALLAQLVAEVEQIRQPVSRVVPNEEILNDWESRSPSQRRTLAIRYLGAPNTIKAEEADALIKAEVKKRADAKAKSAADAKADAVADAKQDKADAKAAAQNK